MMISWINVHRAERVFRVVQWLLVGAAIWVVADILLPEGRLPRPAVRMEIVQPSESAQSELEDSGSSLEQLAGLWARDLRQTLIQPEPEPLPEPAPTPLPAPVRLPRLLATFVEDGRSWGLFVDGKESLRVRTVSGRIDDFTIVDVVPGAATLQGGQRTYEVRVPKPERPGTRHSRRRARW